MAAPRPLLPVVVGVLLGLSFVTGSFLVHSSGPTVVRFDGVELTISYLNGSTHLFGPTEQNACNETLPPALGWVLRPQCPTQLVGGQSYALWFFTTGNPGGSPGLWANMTVTAPFAFELNPDVMGWVPTIYSNASGRYIGGCNFLYDTGQAMGWTLMFTLPKPIGAFPNGLWLTGVLTIQPTNQTLRS